MIESLEQRKKSTRKSAEMCFLLLDIVLRSLPVDGKHFHRKEPTITWQDKDVDL